MPEPTPRELELIRAIYMSILDEPWFNRNVITERELFKLVFGACKDATGDTAVLDRFCREEARRRFSRDGG